MSRVDRKRREAEERRKAILSAARELFWEHGYEKVKVTKVAEAAEVATGTVYGFFPSKDALYVELLIEGYEQLTPRLSAAVREGGSVSQIGGRLIDVFFAFAREFPEYFDIMFFILQREKTGWEQFPEEQIRRLESKEKACKDIVASVLERQPGATAEGRNRTVDATWSMLAGVVFYFRSHESYPVVTAEARRLILDAVFGPKA